MRKKISGETSWREKVASHQSPGRLLGRAED
jgi:hypothetical protein